MFYHGTNSAGKEGIEESGFFVKQGCGTFLNITKNFAYAKSYAEGKRLLKDNKAYMVYLDIPDTHPGGLVDLTQIKIMEV